MPDPTPPPNGATYRDAGVDIAAGDALVDAIKPAARATDRPGTMGGLGGFGALFDLRAAGFHDPVLVAATDGVGTKLLVAIEAGEADPTLHDTLGVDLVAMCVNDLVCQGAEPLFFLDYLATGKLDVAQAARIVAGIARGCADSGCALVGGETAEMPGLYGRGHYDLAGFAVGAAERGHLLPREIAPGDTILGLASDGIHSNGFSLVRSIVERSGLGWHDDAPFAPGTTLARALMTPTRLYVRAVLALHRAGLLRAAAHITGGGLPGNLPRVLPDGHRRRARPRRLDPPARVRLAPEDRRRRRGRDAARVQLRHRHGPRRLQRRDRDRAALRAGRDRPRHRPRRGRLRPRDPAVTEERPGALPLDPARGSPPGPASLKEAGSRGGSPLAGPGQGPGLPSGPSTRVAILISGRGSNMEALLRAAAPPLHVALVLSNRPDAAGLATARGLGVESLCIDHRAFGRDRPAHERAIQAELESRDIHVVCLAGYLRLLTPYLVRQWEGRMLNIHPSLLPAFTGLDTHARALRRGVRLHGCTVHLVTDATDEGPILAQAAVPVLPGDTEAALAARVLAQEHRLYPAALRRFVLGANDAPPPPDAALLNPLPDPPPEP